MKIRRSNERGLTQLDWLESRHTFSFGSYYDRAWMGLGPLRVINDDVVGPGEGFDPHPHQDMEIISFVREGALAHRDSMGHESVVPAGRLQRMSAGRGVIHSEYNASRDNPVHFFQIWIQPDKRGIEPEYEELDVLNAPESKSWKLLASPVAGDGALTIHQDARIYHAELAAGTQIELPVKPGRQGWVHVAKGAVKIGDKTLNAGDAAEVSGPEGGLTAEADGEMLVFEV